MPNRYPKDRFDDLPRKLDRVGAHRAAAAKRSGWVALWWALAATILLVAGGVVGLFLLNERLDFALPSGETPRPSASATPPATPAPSPTPTSIPTPEPTIDPALSITVLNGTPGVGVAGGVAELLAAEGWTVGATADASSEDVPETVVYYADASLEGAARGVAGSVPGSDILLSSDFADSGADLTVVIGNDYVPGE
ncbi:MAG TPA: LytR C-terminal domain-containing protein [Glaciibacter sp.]|nr:LytR C-terminal domain-containing protein [Glaciibacter sp.]